MTKHLISRRVVILCFSLCFIATGTLFSQTNRGMRIKVPTKEGTETELYYKDSYALVIGNGNYIHDWQRLPGALNDVDEVAEALKGHGFHVVRKKDLTKNAFDRAFAEFIHRYGKDKDNRLLFYYAGHGYTLPSATGEQLGYLVMIDTPVPEKDMIGFELDSIDIASFVDESTKIQSRHALFLFDSCFSGSIFTQRDRSVPQHLSYRVKEPVRQFISAGQADEQVPDRSVFKQEFLDLIQGRAKDPVSDGHITGAELGLYLQTTVPKYNNGAQNPQSGKIQDPKLNKGEFVFVLPGHGQTPMQTLPQTGSIFVTSEPAGAQVVFAGVLQPRSTPMQIQDVMAGTHMLKLTLKDYEDYMQQVIVEAGKELKVNSMLRPLPRVPAPSRGRSRLPFIIGGVLAASGAGVAAYVLSSRGDDAGSGTGSGLDIVPEPKNGNLTISISIP